MKNITIRLPEELVAEITEESRRRKISKSDVVRERLRLNDRHPHNQSSPVDFIGDLIGSVDGLPADLSAQKKQYLKSTGYGKKRSR